MIPNLKIGWILSGSEVDPGARILGINIHKALLKKGVNSHILLAPSRYNLAVEKGAINALSLKEEGFNVVIFQKVYAGDASEIAAALGQLNIATVFLASDLCGSNMIELCDESVAVSAFLKKAMPRHLRSRIHVVDDAVETSQTNCKITYRDGFPKLRGIYVGSSLPSLRVRQMLASVTSIVEVTILSNKYNPAEDRDDNMRYKMSALQKVSRLSTMHASDVVAKTGRLLKYKQEARRLNNEYGALVPPEFKWKAWDLKTVEENIIDADIALIPCELISDYHLSKSANRASLFMSLGLPVVASPLPAYTEIIRNGQNGFLARRADEWIKACELLRNPQKASEIGQRGRHDALSRYSIETISERYLSIFEAAYRKASCGPSA